MSILRYPRCVSICIQLRFFLALAGAAHGLLCGNPKCQADEPTRISLWEGSPPGEPETKPEDEPILLMSRPGDDVATTAAVIVCPGGGYRNLALDHEGTQIAEWLNSFGVTAFVLKYRHRGTGHGHPVPMMDGQRAVRTVRSRAAEWGIDSGRIGVMGFSAGGHFASTLGTHFDEGQSKAEDPIERVSSRPDFLILCYPVISFTAGYTHRGSRSNLLGETPDPELVKLMSNELQVTPHTPPTFLFHTAEDDGVLAENSLAFYEGLRKAKVPAELHIYEAGRHGIGLAKGVHGTGSWPDRCREWMELRGILERASAE
jgi:acetyl esterase/lipase